MSLLLLYQGGGSAAPDVIPSVIIARTKSLPFPTDQPRSSHSLPDPVSPQGPLSPATATSAAPGDTAWTNPGNVTAEDGSVASCALFMGFYSEYLQATNFGFTIPAGYSPDGVVVEIKRRDTSTQVVDSEVKLIVGGSIVGTNKASFSTWPASLAYATYGASTDTWGVSLSRTDVNATDFGVALKVVGGMSGGTAEVDHVRITVYFSIPGSKFGGFITLTRSIHHFAMTDE